MGDEEDKFTDSTVRVRDTEAAVDYPTDTNSKTGGPDVVVVHWEPGDPGHPTNWPRLKKYLIVCSVCSITALSIANATCLAIMSTWGVDFYNTTRLGFTVGLTVYNLSVSFTPMILTPISEGFGRNEIYQVTSLLIALLFIPQALSRSYSGFLAARWFQGMASSVGISMVGGTIADMFTARERGKVMNLFSLFVFVGQGSGGLVMGWVGEKAGFQWCFGVFGIACAVSCVLIIVFCRETRADTLLRRRATRLTKSTGVRHVADCDWHAEHKSLLQKLRVTAIRPFQFLVMEPIVTFLSVWVGFAWAVIFLGGTATMLVFEQYGFGPGQTGSTQACIIVGGIIGYFSQFHQEKIYRQVAERSASGHAPPEARLYWAAFGGLLFPAGMMAFAWTGRPEIPWPVPAVMLCISYWGVYCMYIGTFNYLADAYETYSSSAQAAQSFARNTISGIFPLFARQMYIKMGYPQASSLVAALGFVLSLAPFLLIKYGARLRAKSPITSSLVGQL